LPEANRLPLVLGYREGGPQEEAARRLGWTAATLKGRLDRGRELLRRRLARRGLALSVPLFAAAFSRNTAAAALPGRLAERTAAEALRFATAGSASGPAAALAEGALRTLGLARLRLAGAVLLAAAL